MALFLTILAIAMACFALGISFAEIRAEVRARIDASGRETRTKHLTLGRDLPLHPANSNMSKQRSAA
jgi:hypothetical protein